MSADKLLTLIESVRTARAVLLAAEKELCEEATRLGTCVTMDDDPNCVHYYGRIK